MFYLDVLDNLKNIFFKNYFIDFKTPKIFFKAEVGPEQPLIFRLLEEAERLR